MATDNLTYEEAASLFSYNPETGHIIRLSDSTIAGRVRTDGYIAIYLWERDYELAHRLIWLLQTGKYPSFYIDHINRVRSDNRWINLRAANHHDNTKNAKRRVDNTSGVKGVSWSKKDNRWLARLQTNGDRIYVGYFKTIHEAEEAIKIAREKLHKEFANHG